LPEARAAFAEISGAMRGVQIPAENVIVTPGGKPVMFYALLTLVNPGDEVIYPNPGFPIYESVINWLGAKPVPLELREENDFRLDVDELRRLVTPRTKMLIINSPQNPTGSVLSRRDVEGIASLAMKHDFWVLSDEIYSRILYDAEHFSILSVPGMAERTVLLDGHSKTFAMTGWRLGYGIAPKPVTDMMARFATNCNSCTATFVQMAGVAAVRGPQEPVVAMVAEFRRRRDLIVDGLNRIPGMSCSLPLGAFYVFPNVKELGVPSGPMADKLLNEAGVASLSGTAFGSFGEGYLRFSYANSPENIKKALASLRSMVAAPR
jgi:aspartate/methionine/tyrosine aminotransferase